MSRGTRRSDLTRSRQQRKKPRPEWVERWGWTVPLGFIALLLTGTIYWLFASGWVGQKVDQMRMAWLDHTGNVGLAVQDIYMTGREETSSSDVLHAVSVKIGQPILTFDSNEAQKELEHLPWIKTARVERRFPGTIFIGLVERQPLGLYQKNGQQSLVDETGQVLTTQNLGRWRDLPVLVGEQAPQSASSLIKVLSNYPDIYWRIRAMTYINQRRWDLLLNNNVTIRLPEEKIDDALQRVTKAQTEGRVLDGVARVVDVRMLDRLVIDPAVALDKKKDAVKSSKKL